MRAQGDGWSLKGIVVLVLGIYYVYRMMLNFSFLFFYTMQQVYD